MTQGLLNRTHLAQLLACSTSTVSNLWKRGDLKFTRRTLGGPRCSTWEQYHDYIKLLNERGEKYAQTRKRLAA